MSVKYRLPESVFKRSVFAIGTPGAGKSHGVAEGIVIPLLKRDQQAVIIDPTDAWFGLALDKAGKKPSGLNITVFGGEHSSVPLTPNMGRAMGDLLGKEPISAILSIWHFGLQEQISFVSDFSAAIMEVNRKPITLVIDEADEFIPQKPELGNELLKCKTRTKRIVTRGRKSGFRPVLITQRPQALDTAARNGCQVMMAFQCTGHHERSQIEDYVKSNGDPKVMQDMLKSLASLSVGEAWIWAPRDKFLDRIQFPKIDVYDSFDAIDETSVNIKTVPVSDERLEKINAALVEFEEQRKANDTELLRKRIKELEREKTKTVGHPSTPAISADEIRRERVLGHTEGYNEGLTVANSAWVTWQQKLLQIKNNVASEMTSFHLHATEVPTLLTLRPSPARAVVQDMPKRDDIVTVSKHPIPKTNGTYKIIASSSDASIPAPIREILNGLSWWEAVGNHTPSRAQVALVAKRSVKSSSWEVYLSRAKTAGYITYPNPGALSLTDEGRQHAEFQDVGGAKELHARVRGTIGSSEWKILETLINEYPNALSRDNLAAMSGVSAKSSSFEVYVSRLKTWTLCTYPERGQSRASDWLFP